MSNKESRDIALEPKDVSAEAWREYDFAGRVYRIDDPVALIIGKTTHRIIDSNGIVHLVPAPGHCGCALRWLPRDSAKPVQF